MSASRTNNAGCVVGHGNQALRQELPRPSLIDRAVAGDREALAELLTRCERHLRRTIAARLPRTRRSAPVVDDVVQETFLEAVRRINTFKGRREAQLAQWLRIVAERKVVDLVRHRGAARRGEDRVRAGRVRVRSALSMEEPSGYFDPARSAQQAEWRESLRRMIALLPESQALVLRRCDVGSEPVGLVALDLGRANGAVSMLRLRAHRGLKRRLGPGW